MRQKILSAAKQAIHALQDKGLTLSTAESCTSGMIGMALCAASDGGECYSSGFITYDDQSKMIMLGVSGETLKACSAVSPETVTEMAKGAIERAETKTALAVSGYAGPEGGADGTPAGTVWFAWHLAEGYTVAQVHQFTGKPEEVVMQASEYALTELASLLLKEG